MVAIGIKKHSRWSDLTGVGAAPEKWHYIITTFIDWQDCN
jgi:hypothetical protein